MPRWGAIGLMLVVLASVNAAHGAPLRISGSDLLGPGVRAALELFARDNEVTLELSFDGSRPGLEKLRAGEVDVGLFVLPSSDPAPADPLLARIIAYQPAVFVVSERLPLRQITAAQVRGLLAATGAENFSKWGDLGLVDDWRTRAVVVEAVDPRGALTLPLLQRMLFDGIQLRPFATLGTPAQVMARVHDSDNSLGLVPAVPAAGSGLRAVAFAPTVKDPAYTPTAENLHDGSYPLRLPLYVAFRRERAADYLVLLRFLLSEEFGAELAKASFVPLPFGSRTQLVFELEQLH